MVSQLQKDKNLVGRVKTYGKGMLPREILLINSYLAWVASGKELTAPQRKVAEDIDERRVN